MTNTSPFRVCLNVNGQTTGAAGADAAQEGRAIDRFGGANNRIVRISLYATGAQAFSCPKSQYYNSEAYRASTGASPSRPAVWQVYLSPFDEATTTTFDIKTEITYYVMYNNPKFLAQS